MSKTALIEQIESGFNSRAEAERAIDAVTGGVEAILRRKESVSLRGFGTFKVKRRAARTARNPRTGEAIQVSAKDVVVLDSKIEL